MRLIQNLCILFSSQFLREELKYDSGYEKRHKTFHYNDDTQISVKELWDAWLRSEVCFRLICANFSETEFVSGPPLIQVHNWTVEQTADWLSQSVQLPQYVEVFQKHKVSGQTLPRYVGSSFDFIIFS